MPTRSSIDFVHSATAHRTDPEASLTVPANTAVDGEDLSLQLCLTPGGFFLVEVKTSLLLTGQEGSIGLAVILEGLAVPKRSPWLTPTGLAAGMVRVEYSFLAIPGTGRPLSIRLRLRSRDAEATYSVGYISALSRRSSGIAHLPGLGLVAPLAVATAS